MKDCVIITGGTRGIGLTTALKYANDKVHMILTYKSNLKASSNAKNIIKKHFSNFSIIKCNPSNKNDLNKFSKFIKKNKFNVKTLINNQGSTKYINKKNNYLNIHLFQEMMEKNLFNHIKMINLVLPFMKKGSSIINVSSIAAINGKGSNIGYCAAKSALDSVTRSLTHLLAPKVRVNSVCPGLTTTDMTKKAPNKYKKNQISITPMKRLAEPEDIANAIYSISELNTFISGQSIIVDGGRLLN